MYLIGRGNRGRETYPGGSPASALAALVPLSRQRFIDGGTVQTGPNGSVARPFPTIASFMASRANVSVADATANYVGWLTPSLNGYTENIAFPAYASTELRADSISLAQGTVVTGNVTWANIGGAFAALAALVSLHNVSVTGNFTVTDDVGAPGSVVVLSGDEAGRSAVLGGTFTSDTATNLGSLLLLNFLIAGNINAGVTADSASVAMFNSECGGDILARTLLCVDSSINAAQILVSTGGTATFVNTTFTPGSSPVLLANDPDAVTFDGSSWQSFVRAGGTRDTGTSVRVVGGYNGAEVRGAALAAAATNVSLNGVGATAGFTDENSGNHYSTSSATPTSVTLLTGGGELEGDTLLITKKDIGANALAVLVGITTIGTIPANERGFVLSRFTGATWVFEAGGSLAA